MTAASKIHKCAWCDKRYARSNNLSRHENDAHHTEVVRRMKAAGLLVQPRPAGTKEDN